MAQRRGGGIPADLKKTLVIHHVHHHVFDKENVDPATPGGVPKAKGLSRTVLMSTQLDPPRTALVERTVRVNVDDEPEKTVVVNRFGRDETVLDVPRRAESRPRESDKRAVYDLIAVEDRPSMLYYLCACDDGQFDKLRHLLKEIIEQFRADPPNDVAQIVYLPRSLWIEPERPDDEKRKKKWKLPKCLKFIYYTRCDEDSLQDHDRKFAKLEKAAVDATLALLASSAPLCRLPRHRVRDGGAGV